MGDKAIEQSADIKVDVLRLLFSIWKQKRLVALTTLVCLLIGFLVTFFLITPQYESTAMFYVNSKSFSEEDTTANIDLSALAAAKNLVDSYIVILETRETLEAVIDYADVERSYSELGGMIVAESVESTEIFEITVTGPDPDEAERIAEAITVILPERINTIIDGTSAKIVETAVIPSDPCSPDYVKNLAVSFLIGVFLPVLIIILRELAAVTITTEEEAEQASGHPILAAVPDMSAPGRKGGYYYGYGNTGWDSLSGGPGTGEKDKEPELIGGGISFAAAEAYKLLRTKLQLSFTDERDSRVIGISSALSGEGKSLTAVNLAYTLSQLDKKVLLIDCDMRRPTLAEKLHIQKRPGLSGYLTGQHPLEDTIQKCNIKNDENAFDVITAGWNPPNPIELLSSEKMARLLGDLRGIYDQIILDLPPVDEVSDAMTAAKETDGILLVVRQDRCDRRALKNTVRQFDFMRIRILGVVYNCILDTDVGYGKGYGRYYRSFYGRKNAADSKDESK